MNARPACFDAAEPAGASGRLSPEPPPLTAAEGAALKYTPAEWQEVGRALALAALDLSGTNPASRLGPMGGEGLERLRASATWFGEFAENEEDDEADEA